MVSISRDDPVFPSLAPVLPCTALYCPVLPSLALSCPFLPSIASANVKPDSPRHFQVCIYCKLECCRCVAGVLQVCCRCCQVVCCQAIHAAGHLRERAGPSTLGTCM